MESVCGYKPLAGRWMRYMMIMKKIAKAVARLE